MEKRMLFAITWGFLALLIMLSIFHPVALIPLVPYFGMLIHALVAQRKKPSRPRARKPKQ